MNIEFREKYNNFIKIIENKEKNELPKPNVINDFENFKNENKHLSDLSNCSCGISSGYTSEKLNNSKSNSIKSNNSTTNIKKSPMNQKITQQILNKNKSNNQSDDLSLLEDDYFISKKLTENNDREYNDRENNNLLINNHQIENSYDYKSKSIRSEFQNLFMINEDFLNKKIIKNVSSEINDKLENIYNKIIKKSINQNINKSLTFEINKYIIMKKMMNKQSIDENIKKLSILIEFVFSESIRGWNQEKNLYIIQFDKLKENLEKINCLNNDDDINPIKFGFIYRNFNESKAYQNKDFTKYWIGYDIIFDSNNNKNLNLTKYSIKNKILFYCLKNLTKANKFKKKISNWNYKFIKKTVQIYGYKNLIIDIVLIIGIKNL